MAPQLGVGLRVFVKNRLGFVWTRQLVALLGEYEQNRVAYPTFSAFMP